MGILDSIKNVFSGNSSQDNKFDVILKEANIELHSHARYWEINVNELHIYKEKVATLEHQEQIDFLCHCIQKITEYSRSRGEIVNTSDDEWKLTSTQLSFYRFLLEKGIELKEEDFETIFSTFKNNKQHDGSLFSNWPVGTLVNQAEKKYKGKKYPEKVLSVLKEIHEDIIKDKRNSHNEKEKVKLAAKVESIILKQEQGADAVVPVRFMGKDEFAKFANPYLDQFAKEELVHWYHLIALAQKATGSKPSAKFLDESKKVVKELGVDKFKKVISEWFDFVVHFKEKTQQHSHTYAGQVYNSTSYEFLSDPNIEAIKGLVWMCSHFHDQTTLLNVASLAERAYKKIPGKGPASASIGNACLFTLYKSKGLDGIGHLSRLRLRIKQNSTQNLIEKYLSEAAKDQGVSIHEIEDLAVDDYGLVNGKREYELEGYKAVLTVKEVGKTELLWFKPDGSPQKSVPALIKEKQAAKLKKIKEVAKLIEIGLTAQRDRIDRMFKAERKLTWKQYDDYYFNHGLMSFFARKIIWVFEDKGAKYEAIYLNEQWVNHKGEVFQPGEESLITLWHPCTASVQDIKAWREFLIEKQLLQPLKQAFREVYLLTDAEINTRSYSNRMAAHVLKQHQFNSLAKARGWKYSLLGAYDDGRYNESAEIKLPDYKLRAEFWVNEVNADNAYNDTGIWNYITTDQVRFVNAENDEVLQLIDVPNVIFSEVMRDVDLFVGVASVGNDPDWQDNGGVPAYRDYWQSYSFGELTELAKTRKETLERLVPRLKISKVAEIRDKFLVVKGKLRTYKIHIGSTNILMEPNDQYLCIVPDRSQKNVAENVFLPFEGDNGLSIILSKAFLLAEDEKITDATITSQINRK